MSGRRHLPQWAKGEAPGPINDHFGSKYGRSLEGLAVINELDNPEQLPSSRLGLHAPGSDLGQGIPFSGRAHPVDKADQAVEVTRLDKVEKFAVVH